MELDVNRSDIGRKPGNDPADEFFDEEPIIVRANRPDFRDNNAIGAGDIDMTSFGVALVRETRSLSVLPGPCASFMGDLVAKQAVRIDAMARHDLQANHGDPPALFRERPQNTTTGSQFTKQPRGCGACC